MRINKTNQGQQRAALDQRRILYEDLDLDKSQARAQDSPRTRPRLDQDSTRARPWTGPWTRSGLDPDLTRISPGLAFSTHPGFNHDSTETGPRLDNVWTRAR